MTLKPVTGVAGKVEYGYSTTNDAASIDNWQESPTFNDMTYGTYYFFAKVTGDSNHEDAVSSTGTVVAFREISSISITSNPTKMLYTPWRDAGFDRVENHRDVYGQQYSGGHLDGGQRHHRQHPKRYFPDRLPRRPDHHHHLWGKDGCDRTAYSSMMKFLNISTASIRLELSKS